MTVLAYIHGWPLLFYLFGCPFIVTWLIWTQRKGRCWPFGKWWDAEGLPIYLVIVVVAFVTIEIVNARVFNHTPQDIELSNDF